MSCLGSTASGFAWKAEAAMVCGIRASRGNAGRTRAPAGVAARSLSADRSLLLWCCNDGWRCERKAYPRACGRSLLVSFSSSVSPKSMLLLCPSLSATASFGASAFVRRSVAKMRRSTAFLRNAAKAGTNSRVLCERFRSASSSAVRMPKQSSFSASAALCAQYRHCIIRNSGSLSAAKADLIEGPESDRLGSPCNPAPEWRCDVCLSRSDVIKDNSVWSSPQPVSLLVSSSFTWPSWGVATGRQLWRGWPRRVYWWSSSSASSFFTTTSSCFTSSFFSTLIALPRSSALTWDLTGIRRGTFLRLVAHLPENRLGCVGSLRRA
mmetsp:Transcript_17275/g.40898  ORF Transcript_17275/g.40898 Transcript_17275/m.40898 type:complete len:323 (-) Transcript_17275:1518-2486(-)